MLTVLIVSDDLNLRDSLKNAISEISGVEVIGEADNGTDGLSMYENLTPGVVFIDADLQDVMDLAQELLSINPWIYSIFCTGKNKDKELSDYAYDFIDKPIISKQVEKVFHLILSAAEPHQKNDEKDGKRIPCPIFLLKENNKFIKVDFAEIIFINKKNRKTLVHNDRGIIKTDKTLGELIELLNEPYFFRANKGYLVNLLKIKEIVPCEGGRYTHEISFLGTDEKAIISWEKLRELERKGIII